MNRFLAIITVLGLLTCMFFQHTFVMLCAAKFCTPERVAKCKSQEPVAATSSFCMQANECDSRNEAEQFSDCSPYEMEGLFVCPPRPCSPILIKPPLLMAVYENNQVSEYDYLLFALTLAVPYEEQQDSYINHASRYNQTVHPTIEITVLRC